MKLRYFCLFDLGFGALLKTTAFNSLHKRKNIVGIKFQCLGSLHMYHYYLWDGKYLQVKVIVLDCSKLSLSLTLVVVISV